MNEQKTKQQFAFSAGHHQRQCTHETDPCRLVPRFDSAQRVNSKAPSVLNQTESK